MSEQLGNMKRTHYCGDFTVEDIDKRVTIMGWVAKSRDLGALVFADIRDYTGIVQIVFDFEEDKNATIMEKARKIRSEYVLAISGKVRKRSSINDQIPTGQIEIVVEDCRILSESDVPPIYVKDEDNVSEMMKLKYRTLDLRKPHMQEIFRIRSKMYKVTRDYFYENNFVEVETPILSKPTPEGARDYLVPSRVHPGAFYALPQSPQLMKQLLMVSGFDRYIQITRCFRDEDLRFNRQPEFTQIDMELSFVDMEDIININEKYLQKLFKEISNIDLPIPFPRMTYNEAMDRYGVDKPDVRFAMELIDFSEILKDTDFKVFSSALEKKGSIRGILVKNGAELYSRKKIDKLESFVKEYKAKGLAWIKIQSEDIQSPIKKFLSEQIIESLLEKSQAQVGDLLLLVADSNSIVYSSLGNLRNHIANELDLIDKDKISPLWIMEFPLFEYDEEEQRLVAKHHPFTAPMDEDLDKLESEPEKCRAKAYDIVINGDEMGGGSIRIHNENIQKRMFSCLGFSQEEAEEKFGFLLEAFKYGAPPHGGLAYGLDRLCMLLTGEENMRQVIAFPKTQSATDLLTGAPVVLEDNQLKEIHIKTLDKEQ